MFRSPTLLNQWRVRCSQVYRYDFRLASQAETYWRSFPLLDARPRLPRDPLAHYLGRKRLARNALINRPDVKPVARLDEFTEDPEDLIEKAGFTLGRPAGHRCLVYFLSQCIV